jgi:curved DNA-binding protein CbpA
MKPVKPSTDPYRILGILRGADLVQIKAAHRRLAKRYHPDGESADELRFLAVQAAYQLLSDPLRRREWDRQHAPGPVRASAARSRAADRETPRAGNRTMRSRGTPRKPRPQRAPGQRKTTWSAEHVPWWADFRPRAASERPETGPSAHSSPSAAESTTEGPSGPTMDFDVFDRSSGAAWSSAARRHFRRGTADLPSRGAWRYRGTQVVTGAEARKVAAEEEDGKTPT